MLDREGFGPTSASSCSTRRTRCSGASGYAPTPGSSRKGASITARRPSRRCSASSTRKWGCTPDHVRIVARTRDWLRYEVPTHFIRRDARGHYKGQKQIWFLLQLIGRDSDMNLRATDHPEFDAWRWNEYWVPLDVVIEFKRDVYQMALTELARFLPRGAQHNRYLRSGLRPHHRDGRDRSPRGAATPCTAASPARASLATTPIEGTPTAPAPLTPAAARAAEGTDGVAPPRAQASTRLSRWISSGSPA